MPKPCTEIHCDREAAATLLTTSTRNTYFLEKKGLPSCGPGQFHPDETLEWYREYRAGGSRGTPLSEADARLRTAQAALQELKLAQAQGDSLPAELVRKVWGKAAGDCKSRLISIPGKVAPQLVSCNSIAEVKEILERAIYEALDELSIRDYSGIVAGCADGITGGDGAVEAPAKVDGKRVGRQVSEAKPRRQRRARAVVHKPR